jgi:hypothetical protein
MLPEESMEKYTSLEYIRNRFRIRDSVVRQRREMYDPMTGEVKNFVPREFVGHPATLAYSMPLSKWGFYSDI